MRLRRTHYGGVSCGRNMRTISLIERLVDCKVCLSLLEPRSRKKQMAYKRKDGKPTQHRDGMTKSQKVLLFIAAAEDGRHHKELQRFIVELNGYNWEDKIQENVSRYNEKTGETKRSLVWRRRWRGYWSENLGNLLPKFCRKDENGRWYQNFFVGEGDVVMSLNGRYVYKGGPLIDLQKGAPR